MTSWLRRLKARFKYRNFERDLAEELDVHRFSMRDAPPSGSNEPDGRRAAAVAFGNATLAMEEARMIWTPRAVWQLRTDIRWAWRGLRARRWRGPFMIVMLAFALAANTLLFAAADSLLFKPVPYGRADRLVTLNLDHADPSAARRLILTPGLLDDLRRRTDLFTAVHGYVSGSYTFIMDASSPQREPTTFVTPGLIEMLGVSPAAGRGLTVDDAGQIDVRAALVAASLAIERFGSATAAVGQILQTAEEPLQIVGVMPRSFQFPDALARIWRPLDYRLVKQGPFYATAELAPAVPATAVPDALSELSTALFSPAQLSSGPDSAAARISAAPFNQPAAASRPLLLTLLGAALCLLLIVCVNLANLEVASMVQRARLSAIQLALGATPARLRRAAFIEGAALVLVALAGAAGGIWLVHETVALWLPARMTRWSLNPIDFDLRGHSSLDAPLCAGLP
jgi:hypothetical protein